MQALGVLRHVPTAVIVTLHSADIMPSVVPQYLKFEDSLARFVAILDIGILHVCLDFLFNWLLSYDYVINLASTCIICLF